MLTLSVEQIRDLAVFAGLALDETRQPEPDDLETEISISLEAVTLSGGDDGESRRYRNVAYMSDYPEEGAYGLGGEIESVAPTVASMPHAKHD